MNRQGGFTLLEILVVLSLLGVLLGLISTMLVGVNRVVANTERFSDRQEGIRTAQRFLRESISQALPVGSGEGARRHHFVGDAGGIVFFAPLPAAVGGGIFKQSLTVDREKLVLRISRLEGHEPNSLGEPQVLLRDVNHLSFTYRGITSLGKDSGWASDWAWPERLPQQVKISAVLKGPVPWVTELINLKLDLGSERVSR